MNPHNWWSLPVFFKKQTFKNTFFLEMLHYFFLKLGMMVGHHEPSKLMEPFFWKKFFWEYLGNAT
jgi:hypothetical protein